MKTKCVLFIAAIACCSVRGEAPPPPSHITPAVFESREAAEGYVKKLIAGGAVEVLRVGKKQILVLYVYGSGVPDTAIAAYRFAEGKWCRASEVGAALGGIHRALVRDGAIVLISDRSSEVVVLLKADEKEG
jgi:hypothetical protein